MSSIFRVALTLLAVTAFVWADPLIVVSQADQTLRGNLLIFVTPAEVRFRPETPGPNMAYGSRIVARKGIELAPGQSVEVDIGEPQPGEQVTAYLDSRPDFMVEMGPGEGEWYSSAPLRWPGTARIALDSERRPYRPKLPAWYQQHQLVSQHLLTAGFTPEQATVRFLVGLPPGYHQTARRYPALYVTSGFNGNRYTYLSRYRSFRAEMQQYPMILISLDSSGEFGHHLYLDSPANGPRGQVLVDEIVTYVDAHFRTLPSADHRAIYGHSSGGWTAISARQRYPDVFGTALATSPDPLHFKNWWAPDSDNVYRHADGSPHMLFGPLSLEDFTRPELLTGAAGQMAAFEACFSPGSLGAPRPMFDRQTGHIDPEVWAYWEAHHDLYLWARAHPEEARRRFDGHLYLYVGEKDEFGLAPVAAEFSQLLDGLGIKHLYQVAPGAGHSDYVEKDAFLRQLWSTAYQAAAAP
ncbi:MAG: alpha/beta hydrolase [Vulcanimicrobiota bacterium]